MQLSSCIRTEEVAKMSEKRPVFIQIMSPKLEDTVAVLEAVKGKE